MNDITLLRKRTYMTQREFAAYIGVTVNTVEKWDMGSSNCPDYLYNLIEYKLIHENLLYDLEDGINENRAKSRSEKNK